MTDDFLSLSARQRAYRDFADEPVDDATLERILTAATRAPSAENRQPWVFIVVRDPVARAGIGELTARAWELGGREHSVGRLDEQLLGDVDRGAMGGVANAPVLVVVGGDSALTPEMVLAASIFPAVQNLMLAATALGLGSALTTLPTLFAAELRALLGLPDHIVPMAVVPIGVPARALGPNRRRAATDSMHRDRYGRAWRLAP